MREYVSDFSWKSNVILLTIPTICQIRTLKLRAKRAYIIVTHQAIFSRYFRDVLYVT